MNKAQLNKLMDKTQAYHEAYLNKYNKTNRSSKTNNSSKNVLASLLFISLPFIFTIVLNFLLLDSKDNESKITLNKYNNFSDEIIYNNINRDDALDAKIRKTNNPLLFQDNYGISKYEEIIQNYRNNLSNKLGLLNKVIPPSDSTSLKKIN